MALTLSRISDFLTRRVLARLLSTLICCIILVIKPWSRFGGHNAFLLLTLKELVFSAQETLAQHLEATILNITGALFGIGLSTLARYLASLWPDHSVASRTIPALFLVGITFFAGWAKSRLPRLQLSARISCFVSIWLLTTDVGISSGSVHAATFFIWMTLSAASICLISNMLLLRWFSTHFARTLANAFLKLHECLTLSMDESFGLDGGNVSLDSTSRHKQLLDELIAESGQLDSAYSIAAFELRLGRISVESIKPLIGIVENTRRELSWGIPRAKRGDRETFSHSTATSAVNLGHAILTSMKYVEETLLFVFEHARSTSAPKFSENKTAVQILHQLDQARDDARKEFVNLLQGMIGDLQKNDDARLEVEASDQSLFVVSLIEMANDMHRALLIAEKILDLHNTSRTRLWYPCLSWAWLGIAPPTIIGDDRDRVMSDDNDPLLFEHENRLSMAEAREGLSELARWRDSNLSAPIFTHAGSTFTSRDSLRLRNIIYGPRITRLRLLFARCVRAVTHSSHLQHALKNSVGVMLLSLPAFLPFGSPGRRWFAAAHGQWMIISYVWVLETNSGATWRVAYLRIAGTMLGATYAYITWLICRTNPYGLVMMVTLADFPISWLITRTGVSSLGVVASVTLPPIIFAQYLDPTIGTPIIILAVWRAAMITAGVLSALLMNTFVFPKHCRVLFLRNASRTLGLLSKLYLSLSKELFKRNRAFTPSDRRRTRKLELEIRNSLIRLSRLIVALRDEMSLLPKPMMQYRNTISSMQAMLDIMTGLRKIRERIPVREAVSGVLNDRREFVSCVCISLYACEHAFRARQPLPQFLPSTQHARTTLISHIAQTMRDSERVLGMSHMYTSAEGEVLAYLVDTLDSLLNIGRTLFGTAEWLTEAPVSADSSISEVAPSAELEKRDEWHGA